MNFASLTNHIPHRNPAGYTKPYLQRDFYIAYKKRINGHRFISGQATAEYVQFCNFERINLKNGLAPFKFGARP